MPRSGATGKPSPAFTSKKVSLPVLLLGRRGLGDNDSWGNDHSDKGEGDQEIMHWSVSPLRGPALFARALPLLDLRLGSKILK